MLEHGRVVRSIAGHDKDRFYVVLQWTESHVVIADGTLRRLEKPKRKNLKHVRPTGTVLELGAVTSNKKLRILLAPFNNPGAGSEDLKGGSQVCPKQM